QVIGDRKVGGPNPQRRRARDLGVTGMQRRADELHLCTRSQQARLARERHHRHRSQQLDGEARDHHPVPALGALRAPGQQRRRRTPVQRLGCPRPARQLGGDEAGAVELEQRVSHGSPLSGGVGAGSSHRSVARGPPDRHHPPMGLPLPAPDLAPTATRRDLQLGRRLFHLANGVAIASAYALLFTHQQVVHVFGTIACLVYIVDRVRIHYPELAARVPWLNRLFFRAEEQFKESAMIPYAIAILLTILTFPKPAALIAIYTLAIADPLAAIVGIRWGGRELVHARSVAGIIVFFAASLPVALAVLGMGTTAPYTAVAGASLAIATVASVFELIPIRIDDNLTIPLLVGFTAWIACGLFGIALG